LEKPKGMHFKRGMPELLNRNGGSQLLLNKYTKIYKYMAQTKARHRQRQGTTAGVFKKIAQSKGTHYIKRAVRYY
jgi:hypothetical protein